MSGNHWKTLFVSLIYCICFVLVSLVTQFPPGFGAMFNTTISIASGTRWLPAVPAPRTTLRSLLIDTWDLTKSPGPCKTAASVKVPAATGTRPIQPIICQPSDSSLHSSVPVYRLHEGHAAIPPAQPPTTRRARVDDGWLIQFPNEITESRRRCFPQHRLVPRSPFGCRIEGWRPSFVAQAWACTVCHGKTQLPVPAVGR